MNEIYLYKKTNKINTNINVGLCYPSTYFYGMSVLGFLFLFKEFDTNPNVSVQRIFLNSKSLAFNPKQLDLLGFSCVFELDILQVFKILKKYNFNLKASKREKTFPLIFAGGPVVTSNPEPFADFFDFMIIGDGEKATQEIINVYQENKNKSKKEILIELSKIKGIYVPSLYKVKYNKEKIISFYPSEDFIPRTVEKRTADLCECLYSPIISDSTFYANTVFIELSRGCPYECKFCTAHFQHIPVRFCDIKCIKQAIKKAVKHAEKLVFIGAMITSHPDFEEICNYLRKLKKRKNFKVEFSSMDFNNKSNIVPDLLDEKTIFLSIECGSERLRKITGKNLTNKQIFETIDFYVNKGITKFNLYFMIGLPHETEEDITQYIDFSKQLANKYSDIQFLHIISSFNPKPITPYENEKRQSNFILNKYINKIQKELNNDNIEIRYPILQNDNFNALISLGDRRLGAYLEHIFEKNTPIKNMLKEYRKFMKIYNKKHDENNELPHYSKYIYTAKTQEQILPWEFLSF